MRWVVETGNTRLVWAWPSSKAGWLWGSAGELETHWSFYKGHLVASGGGEAGGVGGGRAGGGQGPRLREGAAGITCNLTPSWTLPF